MKNTALAKMYESGEYTPPSKESYINSVIYILTHVSPKLIIHRLTGDCPRDMLVAPLWNKEKSDIINTIVYKMQLEGLFQGCKY
jgi:radical SAM superfamily enzyme